MSEWKPYKLDEIATKLGDGLHGTPIYNDAGEYYFINGSNLVNGKIVINSNTKRVTEEEYIKYKKDLSDRTILLGINGTIGNIALFNNEKCILGKSACYINVDTKFDKQFVKYVLLNDDFQNYIKTNATGTTIKNVGLKLIREYEALIPSDINQQQEIASILSSLDNKIELNLQMNQTLEAMAQAIFKEWFVDFNFPKSLNDDLSDLDDDHDLGNIKSAESFNQKNHMSDKLPKGWRLGSVLEIAKLLSGGTPKTEIQDYWNGDIGWISAKDITSNNGRFILETEKQITNLGIEKSAAKLLPAFTTIISARGTVGNYCILYKEMSISQSNYGLKSINDKNYFLFVLIKNMIEMMKAFSYGTVFDTITTKTFQEMEIIIPDENVIAVYEETVKPIFEKILDNQKNIQSLTQIRDSLLPKLMTGKIDVN